MKIQIETHAGWSDIASGLVPAGSLAKARQAGGLALTVLDDDENSALRALLQASHDGVIVGLREGPNGEIFRFEVSGGRTPIFMKDQAVSRDFIFRSVE